MSFLWSGSHIIHTMQYIPDNNIKKMKPSPTNRDYAEDHAQGPEAYSGGRCRPNLPKRHFIERISLLASLRGKTAASMTVEAAIVLPLVLSFLINLSCAIELVRLHGNLQLALWDVGSRLSVYGHAVEDEQLASMFSFFYIKNQIIDSAGKEYLDSSPLKEGAGGLSFWESDLFTDQDVLDVTVTYSVSPWSGLAGFASFRMANRYYAHIWNGYEILPQGQNGPEKMEVVYVTENGEVYHEDRNCTHLVLTIRKTSRAEVSGQTNRWGREYSPCEICKPIETDLTLYITEDGDRYHSTLECSGLKRTVFSIPKSRAVKEYRACSRCS